jgi:sentrin-specific protease 7
MQALPLLQEAVTTKPEEEVKTKPEDVEEPFGALSRKRKPETRQTRSSPEPRRERSPITWTTLNPGWDKDWHRSLVYPPTGKNRATVDKEDIPRLDEGEFLNDNLISFYLRYLQVQLEKERPEILEKVYIFNTFFFEKLRSNRAKINYEGVRAWTARVDLLSYDYIVVPVNENAHWYLAIIYNAPRLLPQEEKTDTPKKDEFSDLQEAIIVEDNDPAVGVAEKTAVKKTTPVVSLDVEAPRSTRSQAVTGDGVVLLDDETVTNAEAPAKTNKRKSTGGNQKYSTDEPRIITLDSLGAAHTPTCKCLRDYLVEEAKDKKGIDITERPGGMTARGIPEQDNYCDCGVYVLGYMENFLRDPDEAVRRLLQKEASQWDVKPQQIRAKVRDLLFKFQREQHLRLEKEKELKRQRRATKGPVSSPQVAPSSPQVPQRDPETPQAKRDPRSALVNGTTRASSEEPRQTGTTSAYFAVASSEKPVQPQTPTRNEDPAFVQPFRDDSSNESKTSSSGEVFHSAHSSPVNTAQQVLPDLTTGSHAQRSERRGPKQPSTPVFVQELSESPNEVDPASISSTVKRNSSPSATLATRQKASPSTAQGSQGVFDEEPSIWKSIEEDKSSPRGPQYDGVERAIDLTG